MRVRRTGFECLAATCFARAFLACAFLGAAFLAGIGIFMPGMSICAVAGAAIGRSASTLAATIKLNFTIGLQREAPR